MRLVLVALVSVGIGFALGHLSALQRRPSRPPLDPPETVEQIDIRTGRRTVHRVLTAYRSDDPTAQVRVSDNRDGDTSHHRLDMSYPGGRSVVIFCATHTLD